MPDAHGYFCLGTNADYVAPFIGRVPFFLEVNPRMPRTFGPTRSTSRRSSGGASRRGRSWRCRPVVPDERDRRIAAAVVERIPDGATIQVGIGAIPNALLGSLTGHRDLGVHTELLSDGIIDLVERGVVTGTHKQLRRHKIVATFALGTQRLYDFMHENGVVEILPVDYVNDPRVIARERGFVSINATTEVDLMGQCASETMAGRYWSSSGGQADFARGAMYSEGGKAFIVLPSTTSHGAQPDPGPPHRGLGGDHPEEHRRPHRDRVGGRAPARPLARRPRAGADRHRPSRPSRGARAGGAGGARRLVPAHGSSFRRPA